MYLSLATTHAPATDLGFLLMKHPDRVHRAELAFGEVILFYPEASAQRCEAVLTLDIDPVGLVRGRGAGEGLLDQCVNDTAVCGEFVPVRRPQSSAAHRHDGRLARTPIDPRL